MYRLLYYIALIGFFNTLVENKLLNKYDPNLCVLHINSGNSKTAGGTLFYDVSRVSGIQTFMNDVDESFFPVNTVIHVNIFLCSYMRPQTEKLICGDKSLQPPSACVIISNKSTKAYHVLQNMSVSQSSSAVAVIFHEGDANSNSFSLKILLTESSDDKFFFFPENSMFITSEWHSEWFKPAFEQQAENSCQIQVDKLNESYLFDMSSITQTPLFGDKYEFILTCTNVTIIPGLAAGNDVQGTSQFYPVTSQFVYSSHKGIFIRYYGVNKGSNFVQFNFNCVSGKSIPVVKTVLGTENIFDINSTLFCPKKPFYCQETTMSNHIGFSFDALAANVHNYEVPVTNKSKIIFNICHNLLPTPGKPFTGGDILAALESEDGSTINLGVEQLSPAFDNDGQILVHYRGGDSCKEDPTTHHGLTVKLLCNRIKSSQPVLVWAKDCHYKVQWESKAGCLYQLRPFSKCLLQGFYNNGPNFNLTSIKTSEFKTSEGELAISPCGFINASSQVSAVLKQNGGTELTIGKGLPKIEMRDGAIFLTIKGPPCQHGVFFSRINAEFVCQSDMTKSVQPIVQVESCIYNIKWFTNTTCNYETSPVSHCYLETDNVLFNLTALSQGFYTISDQNQTIHFAVCSSLTGPPAVLCGPQSSACWISNELGETNYSSVAFDSPSSGSLSVEGDKLVAHYVSTKLCYKTSPYSFKLIFEYAPGISDTKLEFEKHEKCQVVVKIKTKHSLSNAEIPRPHNVTSHIDSCQRSLEPKIDLTHLKGAIWNSVDNKTMISICGPLPAGLTDEGSGACLVMDGLYKPMGKCISIGLASDVLLYKPRLPYLNYSGPGQEITFVTFPCDSSKNNISFTSLDDITHVVSWPTSASCLNTTADRSDETCTSEHLSRYLGQYKVDIKDSKQYILIGFCVKLPKECLEETAACLVDKTNSLVKYVPIGYHAKNISTDNFGNVVLNFKNGALCNRRGQQYTTILKLICENSNKTYSTYEYEPNNCIHLIEFKGLIGCKTNDRSSTNDSERHKQINVKKNDSISLDTCSTNTLSPLCLLENLAQTKPIEVSNKGNSRQYLVDFNLNDNSVNHCGVSVCRYDFNRWKPVANYHNVTYFEQNNTYKLEYESTSPNPSCNGFSGAEIFLHCNVDKSTATSYNLRPNLEWENECSIGIEWVTDLACLHPKNVPTTSTSTGYNWTMISLTILAILFPCIMIIVLRKKFCKFFCQYLLPFHSRSRSDFLRVYDHSSLSTLSNGDENTVLFVNPHVQNINDSLI